MSEFQAVEGSPDLSSMINDLAADLKPVRRLAPPGTRALTWLAVVGSLALLLAACTNLGGMLHRLEAVPDMWLAMLGSTLTTIFGAIATFQLSLPDRRATWAWLVVPGLVIWLGASGLGCLRGFVIDGMQPASAGDAKACFVLIVGFSVPLALLLLIMIRRAYPLRPGLTTTIGGLTVAAAAATLLTFIHPHDASAIDLVSHVLAVGSVVVIHRLLARPLFGRRGYFDRRKASMPM